MGLHSHNYINIIWCCSTEFQSFSFKSYSLKHSTTPFLSFLYTKGRTYTHQINFVRSVAKIKRKTCLIFVRRVGKTRFAHVNKNVIKYCSELSKDYKKIDTSTIPGYLISKKKH